MREFRQDYCLWLLTAPGVSFHAQMRQSKLGSLFGILLRERREALGLTQEKVAAKAGIHPTHVGLVERGQRTPSLDTAAALASAVGLQLSDMVREAERRGQRQG